MVNRRMVNQKEWDFFEVVVCIAPILQQDTFYGRHTSADEADSFCFAIADMMEGIKKAPGRLESMKYARINTATLKLTAGVNPATLDIKNVNESSCKPYPLMEIGTRVMK